MRSASSDFSLERLILKMKREHIHWRTAHTDASKKRSHECDAGGAPPEGAWRCDLLSGQAKADSSLGLALIEIHPPPPLRCRAAKKKERANAEPGSSSDIGIVVVLP